MNDQLTFRQVLLSRDEFETLSLLLSDYESSDISVDLFAAGLMNLIADAEKVRNAFVVIYCRRPPVKDFFELLTLMLVLELLLLLLLIFLLFLLLALLLLLKRLMLMLLLLML